MKRQLSCLTLTAAGLLALLPAGPAHSHALESSLERLSALNHSLNGDLLLQSRFGNGEPAQEATVRLIPPGGGEPIELGRTDTSGSLRFSLPRQAAADWEVQIDAGPGHRDYLELAESTDAALNPEVEPVAVEPMARAVNPRAWLSRPWLPGRGSLDGGGLASGGLLVGLSAAGLLALRQRLR